MDKKERTKLIIVIGLAVVMVLFGYFRFFHGKGASPAQPGTGAATAGAIAVPNVDLKGIQQQAAGPPQRVSPPLALLRNIFVPAGKMSAPAGSVPGAPLATPPRPLPTLQLTGIIIGGKRPLAIINGRYMRLGESIEGCEVISIERNHVTLTSGGRNLVLNMMGSK